MGCDYYIIKQLRIKYIDDHDDELEITHELSRDRCYFNDVDSVDSDDTDYFSSDRYNKYLEVTYKPRVLFQNGKWKNTQTEEKYYNSVMEEIGHNTLLLSVIKEEVRYLR